MHADVAKSDDVLTLAMRTVRRTVASGLFPFLSRYYSSHATTCPDSILTLLGIANLTRRRDFVTLVRLVERIEDFQGAILECGVYRGATLLGMAHRLRLRGLHNVKIYGCDSFEGFPEPTQDDAGENASFHPHVHKGYFGDTRYERLLARIRALGYDDQIRLVKGFFENTLETLNGNRFSLVHLDVDLYGSYQTCLHWAYPRTLPGGYIVLDEYDFSEDVYPGAKRAIDEFLADKPEKLERFPAPEVTVPRYFIKKA
ncbi:MAG TPA: TylF/MycF/NovP-related O-methyltransferase [Candidatus Eisenbacteria bacterium]|nr:TylF/MycF/NovP-related O-methyltransferase [Candidatus Eisenbacteria bacterium]